MFNNGIIIDAIADYLKLDLKVKHEKTDDLGEFGGMYVTYDMKHGDKSATIIYKDEIDSDDEYSKVMYDRLGSYLPKSGYDFTPENMQVLIILHEFGHVDFMSKLDKMDCLELHYVITQNTVNVTRMSFNPGDIEDMWEEGIDVPYMLRGDEMYADAYAIKNFIPIINHLQEKGLI